MMVDSKKIDDGGHAFPVCFEGGQNSGEQPYFHEGMSLRDWFAGQALVGQLAFSPPDDPYNKFHEPEDVARMCYQFADAFLAARKGGAA